jgi:hypothetical protein
LLSAISFIRVTNIRTDLLIDGAASR